MSAAAISGEKRSAEAESSFEKRIKIETENQSEQDLKKLVKAVFKPPHSSYESRCIAQFEKRGLLPFPSLSDLFKYHHYLSIQEDGLTAMAPIGSTGFKGRQVVLAGLHVKRENDSQLLFTKTDREKAEKEGRFFLVCKLQEEEVAIEISKNLASLFPQLFAHLETNAEVDLLVRKDDALLRFLTTGEPIQPDQKISLPPNSVWVSPVQNQQFSLGKNPTPIPSWLTLANMINHLFIRTQGKGSTDHERKRVFEIRNSFAHLLKEGDTIEYHKSSLSLQPERECIESRREIEADSTLVRLIKEGSVLDTEKVLNQGGSYLPLHLKGIQPTYVPAPGIAKIIPEASDGEEPTAKMSCLALPNKEEIWFLVYAGEKGLKKNQKVLLPKGTYAHFSARARLEANPSSSSSSDALPTDPSLLSQQPPDGSHPPCDILPPLYAKSPEKK